MQRQTIKPRGIAAPMTVPNPGSVSAVGPSGKVPSPRVKNTRDYGKPAAPPAAPAPSPNPFGPTTGGSRIGGI